MEATCLDDGTTIPLLPAEPGGTCSCCETEPGKWLVVADGHICERCVRELNWVVG